MGFYSVFKKGLAVSTRIHADGTEELLRFAKGNSFLGIPNHYTVDSNLSDNDTSVYAYTDCILYKIPNAAFKKISYASPEILEFIIVELALETRIFRKQMDFVAHKQTINALASLLINLCQETPSGFLIPSTISNNNMATYLKIHFVTVSKMMKTLLEAGILEKKEKQLYIRDYEQLLEIASGDKTI